MGKEIAFKFIQEIASKIKPKSASFLAKQAKDIELFGEKQVLREGVTDDMLQAFTPFRRLSKKTCSLSDPKYFIEQYEKIQKILPHNWSELTEKEKVDLIVKERYERLVANKIMNAIKNEPVEHSFSLAYDGEILSHDIGNDISVEGINSQKRENFIEICEKFGLKLKGSEYKPHSSVHVHPNGKYSLSDNVIEYLKTNNMTIPKAYAPFSDGDLRKYCGRGELGFVIDQNGNKFKFTPFNIGKKDYSAGESVNRLYGTYEASILNPLYERVEIAYKRYLQLKENTTSAEILQNAENEVMDAKVKFQTTMLNMQYRKEYLQSKEVTDYFGIFEELGNR